MRKHKWKITPKGTRYMNPYISSTQHLEEKSKGEK
jgi:hypothetical protein